MRWKHRLAVADVFHSDTLDFTQRRDAIVARIKASPFWDESDLDLVLSVEALENSDDEDEFDDYWDSFYDWCDRGKRVWVETT